MLSKEARRSNFFALRLTDVELRYLKGASTFRKVSPSAFARRAIAAACEIVAREYQLAERAKVAPEGSLMRMQADAQLRAAAFKADDEERAARGLRRIDPPVVPFPGATTDIPQTETPASTSAGDDSRDATISDEELK